MRYRSVFLTSPAEHCKRARAAAVSDCLKYSQGKTHRFFPDRPAGFTDMSMVRFYCVAAAAGILGCGGTDAPRTPLSEKSSTGVAEAEAIPAITGEAKIALDSGNTLFRAKAYDRALAQYQQSALLAPTELAPLLGIMMVADVTKDSKLSEQTLPRIRRLDPAVATSAARVPHSKIIERHPRPRAIR
jgi:hypothetical protein